MKPHNLKVIDGPDKGREFCLDSNPLLLVGRGTASDTQINDPRVSRVHCRVELQAGKAILTAEENAGDTLVAGKPVKRHVLNSGDVFRIGNTFLRFETGANPMEQSTMSDTGPMEALVGSSFATYRLDAILTRGKTSVIYKATDTKSNRGVAVKVLLPKASYTEEQRERFVRAMRTVLPLKHPNIIPLYHAGKHAKFCWIAMELIEGEGMDSVIQRLGIRDMLDWRQVWEVAIDIGRALAFAGEHKIIHRNLSPSNIVCRTRDKVNLLGGLMLAKALEGNQAFDVTSPGQLVGDVTYMSPERTMDDREIDARSDIYELGAVLYALLTGRPPFEQASLAEQIDKVRNAVPDKPKKYQIGVNDQFQDIVMTMLEKRPQDRFDSASALLVELERIGSYAGLKRA